MRRTRTMERLATVAFAVGAAAGFAGCTTNLQNGPPPQALSSCQPEQVQVLILGTFHFAQQDELDILSPDRQEEIDQLLNQLAAFAPNKVTVETAYERNGRLNASYQRYLEAPEGSLGSAGETAQIGFRLARRLGHDRVFGVDVPMTLWHDSIQVFDDQYPGARQRLRSRWNVQYPSAPKPNAELPLPQLLRPWNTGAPPAMPEYGRFMPLVEGDVYAGALKLRPWYDRNLRIVQNFFRVLEPEDDRLFMVVGGSHVPVLRHIIDMTPQLCAIDPLPYLYDGTAAS